MLTAAEYQALILREVGDLDPATLDPPTDPSLGVVAQEMARLWALHSDKALRGDIQLQALYVQREALRLILGRLGPRTNYSEGSSGVSVHAHDEVLNRQQQLKEINEAIDGYEEWLTLNAGAPVGAQLLTTAPISPPRAGMLDANAPWLSGSPYWRQRRVIGR